MSRGLTIAVVVLAGILMLALAAVFFLVLRDVVGSGEVAQAPTLAPTADVSATPTSTELAPPVVEVPPTFTAVPSDTPGDPTPTNTPGPSSTPQPTIPPVPTMMTSQFLHCRCPFHSPVVQWPKPVASPL